ncbi:MAG: helix-turn-helix domain-containing protein, partial [Halobacteriales archaeon]|nr:helix-turn-helix domain-containing protein [Halobacteriales archaeon]
GSAMREVMVRFSPTDFLPARFTCHHPQARLVHQALAEEKGEQRQLLVLLAGPEDARDFLARVGEDPQLVEQEVLSRDDAHVSVRIRRRSAEPDPLVQLAAALGRDAYPKPAVVEQGRVLGRVVVMRRLAEEELAGQLEELAQRHGWRDAELVGVRDVGVEGALLARPRNERMTARQEEVLRIAHALGYYRTPRGCTLESIAGTLGISANAVHKNLTAAEQRIIADHVTAAL